MIITPFLTAASLYFTEPKDRPKRMESEKKLVPYFELQPIHTVPDVMPYNLMMAPVNNSYVDIDIIQRVALAIDSRAREAVVVYNETDNSTIGFDVKIKGDPLFLAPIILDEDSLTGVKHCGLFVNLPAKPGRWESAQTSLRHKEKDFTKREKFMRSKHSDLLLKFRNPDADFLETSYAVNQINKKKNLSLDGITKVNRIEVLADKYEEYFNQAFNKGTHSKAVLEFEYQKLKISRSGWNLGICAGFYVGVMFAFLVALGIFIYSFKEERYKSAFLALFVAITFLELIVWGGIIF